MEVLVEVTRVGAEAEAEMMTVDTHAATEIALMRLVAEMAIFTEEVAVLAHALGVRIDTTVPEAIAVIEMMPDLEKTAATEHAQVKAQSERLHLP